MALIQKLQDVDIPAHEFASALMVWFEAADGAEADAERAKIGDWFSLTAGELTTLDGFRTRFQGLTAAEQLVFAWRVHTAAVLLQTRRSDGEGGVEHYFDGADAVGFLGL